MQPLHDHVRSTCIVIVHNHRSVKSKIKSKNFFKSSPLRFQSIPQSNPAFWRTFQSNPIPQSSPKVAPVLCTGCGRKPMNLKRTTAPLVLLSVSMRLTVTEIKNGWKFVLLPNHFAGIFLLQCWMGRIGFTIHSEGWNPQSSKGCQVQSKSSRNCKKSGFFSPQIQSYRPMSVRN